jgi:amino acid adenylation domain-containing protein
MSLSAYASPNATTTGDPALIQNTVVALFQTQVASRPLSVALEINEKSFTYAVLNSRVDRVVYELRTRGVKPGDVVAICLKRTENLVIAMLSILKVGAAYLPLTPSDPPLRIGQVLSHASPRAVISDSQSDTHLAQAAPPAILPPVLLLDRMQSVSSEMQRHDTRTDPKGKDLAYVIYTSGTTGTPKGVAITHAALENIFSDVAGRVGFAETSSWLAVTNVSFDIAALELLLPLCYGGKVILVSEEQARIGRVLAGMIRRKKPTVMQATPITWRILIESGWAGSPDMTLLCGGDRLDRDLANKLVVRAQAVWNMYGPTETTIWSTADRLASEDGPVTIGKPLRNTAIYVLDGQDQLAADGEIGEICIGGQGLARGYFNDPLLTRRFFVDLRLNESGSTRVYRTGDLGRWDKNGKLEFFGRIDHQVKINGFRIELGEVESVIRNCNGIEDAAVLGVDSGTNQKRLYAFVVGEADITLTTTMLVEHMSQYLPKYMIPEKFWSIDRLPSTAHGKRDVKALQALSKREPSLPGPKPADKG